MAKRISYLNRFLSGVAIGCRKVKIPLRAFDKWRRRSVDRASALRI